MDGEGGGARAHGTGVGEWWEGRRKKGDGEKIKKNREKRKEKKRERKKEEKGLPFKGK